LKIKFDITEVNVES